MRETTQRSELMRSRHQQIVDQFEQSAIEDGRANAIHNLAWEFVLVEDTLRISRQIVSELRRKYQPADEADDSKGNYILDSLD